MKLSKKLHPFMSMGAMRLKLFNFVILFCCTKKQTFKGDFLEIL